MSSRICLNPCRYTYANAWIPQLTFNLSSDAGGANYTSPQNGFVETALYSVFNVTSTSPLIRDSSPSNASYPLIPDAGPSNGSSPSSVPDAGPSNASSPSSVPKIVGGILGGLALITIILSCILLFLHRRRKYLQPRVPRLELSAVPGGMAEMAAREAPAMELPSGYWGAELPSGYWGAELPSAECTSFPPPT